MEATGSVEIKETGIAVGNIKTDSLIINKGGIFSGNVTRMSEEPVAAKKKGKADTTVYAAEEESSEKEEYSSLNYGDNEDKTSSDNSRFNNEENLSL